MKTITSLLIGILLISCTLTKTNHLDNNTDATFTIAFGSCNDQKRENELWNSILENNPNVWIWGGDNIYADTEDMKKMEADYLQLVTNAS